MAIQQTKFSSNEVHVDLETNEMHENEGEIYKLNMDLHFDFMCLLSNAI